jgi:hypothetical protein
MFVFMLINGGLSFHSEETFSNAMKFVNTLQGEASFTEPSIAVTGMSK